MPPKKKCHYKGRVIVIPVKALTKYAIRIGATGALVVVFVYVIHGLEVRELTFAACGIKFMEVITDVIADRVFPQLGEDV